MSELGAEAAIDLPIREPTISALPITDTSGFNGPMSKLTDKVAWVIGGTRGIPVTAIGPQGQIANERSITERCKARPPERA